MMKINTEFNLATWLQISLFANLNISVFYFENYVHKLSFATLEIFDNHWNLNFNNYAISEIVKFEL